MSARIISFAEARQKLVAKRLSYTQIDLIQSIANSSASRSQCSHVAVNNKYNEFVANMHTRRAEFMFPSVLSDYRKGINPVDALYNNLQKSLFNYSKHDKSCTWIVGLFKDTKWTDRLCNALEQDCTEIDAVCCLNSYTSADIDELKRIKLKFLHYTEVFKLMKTWSEH